MIYKPTSPVPFNTVLKEDKTFSFNVGNPKLVTDFRVSLIDVDGNTYNYPVTSKTGDTSSCSWQYSEDNDYDYAFVQNGDTYERQENQKYAIKDNMGYSWKTRLYSGTPTTTTDNNVTTISYDNVKLNSNIGYGTIHEIINLSVCESLNNNYGFLIAGENTDGEHSILRLKINAHANMFIKCDKEIEYKKTGAYLTSVTYYTYSNRRASSKTILNSTNAIENTTLYPNISAFDSNHKAIAISGELTENYDNGAVYYIQIKGVNYRVRSYYYSYGGLAKNSSTYTEVFPAPLTKDSYDTPLYAYVEIEVENTDGLICDSSGNPWDDETSTGNKYTNIDLIPFSENDEYSIWANYIDSDEYAFSYKPAPKIIFIDKANGDTRVTFDSSPYEIAQSNINLQGTYTQSSGSMINYYRAVLYNADKTAILDDTGMVYDTEINYEYHLFFPNTSYKLEIQIVDSDNVTILKTLQINCNYTTPEVPFDIDVGLYPAHGSVVVDFSKFIPISGSTDKSKLSFNEYTIDNKSFKTCSVQDDNAIVYDQYDTHKPLQCETFLLTMIVKIDVPIDNNVLFEYTDDNDVVYTLTWNGSHLVYTKVDGEIETTNSILLFESAEASDIEAGLADSSVDYGYPYMANLDIHFNPAYYYHIEDKLQSFYWQIIATPDMAYIRCIETPTGTDVVTTGTVEFSQGQVS